MSPPPGSRRARFTRTSDQHVDGMLVLASAAVNGRTVACDQFSSRGVPFLQASRAPCGCDAPRRHWSSLRVRRLLGHTSLSQSLDGTVDIGLLEAELLVLHGGLLEIEARIELEQLRRSDACVVDVAELAVGVCKLDLIPPPV